MRSRASTALTLAVAMLLATATSAAACGGLVAANGSVQLLRTATLAAYVDGVEHYITSFEFGSAEESFGSIVPLPGVPTYVARGGDWTLQRLAQEVAPPAPEGALLRAVDQAADEEVEVLLETRIDSLDITVVRGGGAAVAEWADQEGFVLPDDAPEMLEFYAARSPVFMAARFDVEAAAADSFELGDGVPVHLTIPTDNPWVPLRILSLGKADAEIVDADVYLLTPDEPAVLTGQGVTRELSQPASASLLADLRSDEGMDWIPADGWLTYLRVRTPAWALDYDLAVDVTPVADPSIVAAGFADPLDATGPRIPGSAVPAAPIALAAVLAAVLLAWWVSRRLINSPH